ncbi:g2700 [Coccomyxa elongata]
MSSIYGEHYIQSKDIKDLTGKFNAHTANKMFVNLDEATFGGYKQDNQILKNFITESMAVIEEKFKDPMTINSYVNLAITTNEDFPVEISEHDRRYFVLQCSDDIANNHEYWGPLLPLF